MATYMNKYSLGSEAKVCATIILIKVLHFDSFTHTNPVLILLSSVK